MYEKINCYKLFTITRRNIRWHANHPYCWDQQTLQVKEKKITTWRSIMLENTR